MDIRTFFIKSGKTVRFITAKNDDINDKLDAGVYIIDEDNFGLFLAKDDIPQKTKLYGVDKIEKRLKILYNELNSKNKAVLLYGEKGTGKSAIVKNFINDVVLKDNAKVLIVNKKLPPRIINEVLSVIHGKKIVVIDEFEKLYPHYTDDKNIKQQEFLTFLDGIESNKQTLFIFTANDYYQINPYFLNRPSRVRYVIRTQINSEILKQIITDKLKNMPKNIIDNVYQALTKLKFINYDIINEVINEIFILQKYGEEINEKTIKEIILFFGLDMKGLENEVILTLEDYNLSFKNSTRIFEVHELPEGISLNIKLNNLHHFAYSTKNKNLNTMLNEYFDEDTHDYRIDLNKFETIYKDGSIHRIYKYKDRIFGNIIVDIKEN